MRVSGKDLIQNHLTYLLFNHVAMWSDNPARWPVSIRANGHLLLNNEKMSKQTGNFMTLTEGIDTFSADGMRLALADAGDAIEDANFVYAMADAGVLRLYNFLEWTSEMLDLKKADRFRTGKADTFNDRVFSNEMNKAVGITAKNYEATLFKEAVKTGFYEFQTHRDKYRELCGGDSEMHVDLVVRFIEIQALILAPICPHIGEQIWQLLNKKEMIVNACWPETEPVDELLLDQSTYMDEAIKDFRSRLRNIKSKKPNDMPPTHATIYVAKQFPSWQGHVLKLMQHLYKENGNCLPDNKSLSRTLASDPQLTSVLKKTMPFVQMIRERLLCRGAAQALSPNATFDQADVLAENVDYLRTALQVDDIGIVNTDDQTVPTKIRDDCCPGAPFVAFTTECGLPLTFVNINPCNGLFELSVIFVDGDSMAAVIRRLRRASKSIKPKATISLWRFVDPIGGPRKLRSVELPREHLEMLPDSVTFKVDLDIQCVHVKSNDSTFPLGGTLVYVVE